MNAPKIVWVMTKDKKLANYNDYLERQTQNKALARDYYTNKDPINKPKELEMKYKNFSQPVVEDSKSKYVPPKFNFIKDGFRNNLMAQIKEKERDDIFDEENKIKEIKKQINNLDEQILISKQLQEQLLKSYNELEQQKVIKIPGNLYYYLYI